MKKAKVTGVRLTHDGKDIEMGDKPQHIEGQPYLDGCEPKEVKKSQYEETVSDLGWCKVTKETRFDWDEDLQAYRRTPSGEPRYKVCIPASMQKLVRLEQPLILGLSLDEIGELLEAVEDQLSYIKGLKRELESQSASLINNKNIAVGEEYVVYRETKTTVKVRKRTDNDVPSAEDHEDAY